MPWPGYLYFRDGTWSDTTSDAQARHTRPGMSEKNYTFVVEHLDPELGPWSALEYKTIAKESRESSCRFILSSVPQALLETQDLKDLQESGVEARSDSIETYFANKKERICLLDPGATQELQVADADSFEVFLFGGILGGQRATTFNYVSDDLYRR